MDPKALGSDPNFNITSSVLALGINYSNWTSKDDNQK
jgi:hypothetical protein